MDEIHFFQPPASWTGMCHLNASSFQNGKLPTLQPSMEVIDISFSFFFRTLYNNIKANITSWQQWRLATWSSFMFFILVFCHILECEMLTNLSTFYSELGGETWWKLLMFQTRQIHEQLKAFKGSWGRHPTSHVKRREGPVKGRETVEEDSEKQQHHFFVYNSTKERICLEPTSMFFKIPYSSSPSVSFSCKSTSLSISSRSLIQ